MEVTKFLHQCESSGTSQMTDSSLPTLFGNNNMKMDVACKVLIAILNTALFFIKNSNLTCQLKHLMVGAASFIFYGQITYAWMQPIIYEKFLFFLKVAENMWELGAHLLKVQIFRGRASKIKIVVFLLIVHPLMFGSKASNAVVLTILNFDSSPSVNCLKSLREAVCDNRTCNLLYFSGWCCFLLE